MATAKKTTTKATARTATTKSTATRSQSAQATSAQTRSGRDGRKGFDLGEVDLRALVTDYAYATLGASDLAIEMARGLPQRLEAQRKARAERTQSFVKDAPTRAQSFVKDAPARLQSELDEGVATARKELETYATRGRKVVDSIAKAPQTKRALGQSETARSQVKGAVTSLRKAVEQGQDAVEGAVRRIGKRRSTT